MGKAMSRTITDVGKEAVAAASYRGRDASTMCRRGEVTAWCREGSAVFADVGKVVITAAWCRRRAAAAICCRGDVAGRGREGIADVDDVGKEAVTTNGGEWAPHRIRLALGRKPPPPLCDPGGRRVKKGEMRNS
jgi:hypothetical protein